MPDKEKTDSETEEQDESTWARDQQKHSYYYDDSTGYEIYDPEADDEDDQENESSKPQ